MSATKQETKLVLHHSSTLEKCVFNRLVIMNIMNLSNLSLLYVVDCESNFSVATFLESETSAHIWKAFIHCWFAFYVGFLDKKIWDLDPRLQWKEFVNLLLAARTSSRGDGSKSRSPYGETECYHTYFRNIFEQVCLEYERMKAETMLMLA